MFRQEVFGASFCRVFALAAVAALLLTAGATARADLLISIDSIGKVKQYNQDTGALLGTLLNVGGADQVTDVAISQGSGRIYVGSGAASGKILRYDFLGNLVDTFATGFGDYVRSLAFGPDGYLYASANGTGRGIYRLDPSTTYSSVTPYIVQDATFGLTFDSSGNLYASTMAGNKVNKYNPTTKALLQTFDFTSIGNQVFGIDVDDSGNVYGASLMNNRVLKATAAGAVSTLISGAPGYTNNVVCGSDGKLYVMGAGNGELWKYNMDGTGGAQFIATGNAWAYGMAWGTVPEPSVITLLFTGVLGLLAYAWRKRK